jgi:hypothetical protein
VQRARAEMTEPIVTISNELQAADKDVAAILLMSAKKESRILMRHHLETLEQEGREQREADS